MCLTRCGSCLCRINGHSWCNDASDIITAIIKIDFSEGREQVAQRRPTTSRPHLSRGTGQ